MERIKGLNQEELANILCLTLVFTGMGLGGLSLFTIPGFDKEEARSLSTKAFGVGISIGFGVSISPAAKRRKQGQENSNAVKEKDS